MVFLLAFGSAAGLAMRFVSAPERSFDVRFPRPPEDERPAGVGRTAWIVGR